MASSRSRQWWSRRRPADANRPQHRIASTNQHAINIGTDVQSTSHGACGRCKSETLIRLKYVRNGVVVPPPPPPPPPIYFSFPYLFFGGEVVTVAVNNVGSKMMSKLPHREDLPGSVHDQVERPGLAIGGLAVSTHDQHTVTAHSHSHIHHTAHTPSPYTVTEHNVTAPSRRPATAPSHRAQPSHSHRAQPSRTATDLVRHGPTHPPTH